MLNKRTLLDLVSRLVGEIDEDYRSSIQEPDDETPMMDVTIACDSNLDWTWQTGDNSYSGSIYSYPHWAVVYLSRDDDPESVVTDIIDQLGELLPESVSIPATS